MRFIVCLCASGEVSWSWDVIRIIGGNQLETLFKVHAIHAQGDILATVLYVIVAVVGIWWTVRRFWRPCGFRRILSLDCKSSGQDF